MRFWWVRHAPTGNKNLIGWSDVAADLSDKNLIARVREVLPSDAFILSSDLLRARQTRDALCGQQSKLPDDARLREIHFGQWEGKSHEAISKTHPELSREFWTRPDTVAAPKGEDWLALSARVQECVNALYKDHKNAGKDIILISHMGPILCQFQRVMKLSIQDTLAANIDHLSVSCFETDGQRWRVHYWNHKA